jgi:Flp pilus assembly protein TadD
MELDSHHAESINGLGEAYQAKGEMKEAQRDYERAFACDSTFTLPLRNLGALLITQGNETEAISYYKKAADLGDIDAMIFLRTRENKKKE